MDSIKTVLALVGYRHAMRTSMIIQADFNDGMSSELNEKLTNDITASEDRIMQLLDSIIDGAVKP